MAERAETVPEGPGMVVERVAGLVVSPERPEIPERVERPQRPKK